MVLTANGMFTAQKTALIFFADTITNEDDEADPAKQPFRICNYLKARPQQHQGMLGRRRLPS